MRPMSVRPQQLPFDFRFRSVNSYSIRSLSLCFLLYYYCCCCGCCFCCNAASLCCVLISIYVLFINCLWIVIIYFRFHFGLIWIARFCFASPLNFIKHSSHDRCETDEKPRIFKRYSSNKMSVCFFLQPIRKIQFDKAGFRWALQRCKHYLWVWSVK